MTDRQHQQIGLKLQAAVGGHRPLMKSERPIAQVAKPSAAGRRGVGKTLRHIATKLAALRVDGTVRAQRLHIDGKGRLMAVPMIEGALFVAGQLHASGRNVNPVRRLRSGVGHPGPGDWRGSSSVTRTPFGARRSSSIATAAPLKPPPIITICGSALIAALLRYAVSWSRSGPSAGADLAHRALIAADGFAKRTGVHATRLRRGPVFQRQQRHHQLSKAVRFFQMWVTGEDKVADAERLIFADAFRYLLRITYQRGTRAAAHQSDAGPQIGRNAQIIARSLMQGAHPRLAGRVHAGEDLLRLGNSIVVKMGDQPVGGGPCLFFRFAHNDMQTNAVLQGASAGRGALAHHRQLLRHQFRGSPHVR